MQVEGIKAQNEKVEDFQKKRSAKVIQKNMKNRGQENWDKLKADLAQVAEKRSEARIFAFAGYEMIFWQSRHMKVTDDSIVYSHIGPGSQPVPIYSQCKCVGS